MLVTSVCLGWRSAFPFLLHELKSPWLRPLSHTSRPGLQSSGVLLLFYFQCEDTNQNFPSEVGRPTRQASSVRNRVTLSKSFNSPKSFRVPEPWFSTCSLKDQPSLLHRVTVRMKYNMRFVGCSALPGIHSLYSFNAWLYFAIKCWWFLVSWLFSNYFRKLSSLSPARDVLLQAVTLSWLIFSTEAKMLLNTYWCSSHLGNKVRRGVSQVNSSMNTTCIGPGWHKKTGKNLRTETGFSSCQNENLTQAGE